MFVFLCQTYITFNSKSTVSEWWVGVVYLHAMIKRKISYNPFLLQPSQLYTHPSPLCGLRLHLRLTSGPGMCNQRELLNATLTFRPRRRMPCLLPHATAERRPNGPQMALSAMALAWFHLGQRGSGWAPIIICRPPHCSPCLRPWPFHRIVSGQPENPFKMCHSSIQNHYKLS